MATDVKDLVRIVREAPRALKIILGVLALDILVPALITFTLEDEVADGQLQIEQTQARVNTLHKKIADTRREIARLPELRERYQSAMAHGLLAPQNRLKLVQQSQDDAGRHRQNGLHYKLSAEDVKPIPNSKYAMVSTEVSFDQDALLDTDVLAFWEDLLGQVPAHYHVTAASLERGRPLDASALSEIRAGHAVSLVKAKLDFRWVTLQPPEKPAK